MTSACYRSPGIAEAKLFQNVKLDEADAAALDRVGFVSRRYPAHTAIRHEGDDGDDRTYIVHSGWSCLFKDLADGGRQIIDFPLSGNIVGLRTQRGEDQRSFMSITELLVYEAPPQAIARAMAASTLLTSVFVGSLLHSHAILVEHMANLGRRNALVRTAHLLLELGARLEQIGCATEDGYECPLTQYDLADALGLTPIHVNRMLRKLREHGFLSLRQGRVTFHDRPGLTEFANFNEGYLH